MCCRWNRDPAAYAARPAVGQNPKPKHAPKPLPACYAMVQPGLEQIAAEEIEETLHGKITRTGPGYVVFRVDEIDRSLLRLRTTEDVYLLAWGSDQLTYRAEDLEKIRRWTDREPDWSRLLQIHHSIRPKPKGKPTFRLITQMQGERGYRRIDAGKAMARGLAGKLPASWKHAEENASLEIWLTIQGTNAVCGVRLSDRTMRHRDYKGAHLPASLRPTVAAAMVRLADVQPGQVVLDPTCGAGTILAEALAMTRQRITARGGDSDPAAVRAAQANLRHFESAQVEQWDARKLPLEGGSVDRIVSNPPFGVQLGKPQEIPVLYRALVKEMNRVLKPRGRAVLLVADVPAMQQAAKGVGWKQTRSVNVRVLGQKATMLIFDRFAATR